MLFGFAENGMPERKKFYLAAALVSIVMVAVTLRAIAQPIKRGN